MIGEALYDLLSTNPAINALAQGRVRSTMFPKATPFPAIAYNTRGVQPLPCRKANGDKAGLLEVAILADNSFELEQLSDTITEQLEGYEGIHKSYLLTLTASDDDFEEGVEELNALHKRLLFDFTAFKQPS